MKPTILTSSTFLLSLVLSTSHAGLIIDTVTGTDNRASMSQDAGQTFTTPVLGTESLLSTISIHGDSGGAANGSTVTAKLWLDTDGVHTTWDPGTLVATSTNSLVISSSDVLFTFNFSNESLSDNTVYVLSFNDGTSDHVSFRSDLNSGADSLSDGSLFSGGVQPFGGGFDASIQVVTVPELSSIGLVGVVMGTAAFMLRRRK